MSTERGKNIFSILREEIASREKEEEKLSPAALLSLPDNLRELMLKITRLGEVTAAQLAQELQIDETEVEEILAELVRKGYLTEEKTYKVAFGRRRTTRLPQSIWESLAKKV